MSRGGCESGQNVKLEEIAAALGVSRTTVQNVRADYQRGGFEHALYNKRQMSDDPRYRKITEEVAMKILELTKEKPPIGKKRWSIRLLCAECESRGILDHVSTGAMKEMLWRHNVDLRENHR